MKENKKDDIFLVTMKEYLHPSTPSRNAASPSIALPQLPLVKEEQEKVLTVRSHLFHKSAMNPRQTSSLSDADPHSDRPACGGRESNLLAVIALVALRLVLGTAEADCGDVITLAISGIQMVDENVVIDMPSRAKWTYQLQSRDSLTTADWQDGGSWQPGSGTTISFTDVGAASLAQRFYRVKASPPIADVAIEQNFADQEIDQLQAYLTEMGLTSVVFDQEDVAFQDMQGCKLIIWDDLSYQSGGLTDNDVCIFKKAFESGIPLYFIGDDLAYSAINLSPENVTNWVSLLHLNPGDNFGGVGSVSIVNTDHPVISGLYGTVMDYAYGLDIDHATRTDTGEVLLASSGPDDVILAYEDTISSNRTVTQNSLSFDALGPDEQVQLKILFKNAVKWLLRR